VEQVNIHEAKTHFSKLVEKAEAGEETVIARNGKPVAKLVPYVEQKQKRPAGTLRGKIWIAPDWDSPEVNEQIAKDFWDAVEKPFPE
jgi:prevent-host-death family protein